MVTFPIVAALAAVHGPLNILHFDAHPDLYDDFEGDPLSPRLALRPDHGGAATPAGSSSSASAPSTRHCRAQAERFGVEIVEMRDFAPERVPIPEAPLYISIDLDGFDPAFAPGVAHHEPGGPSVREFLRVLHRVPGADRRRRHRRAEPGPRRQRQSPPPSPPSSSRSWPSLTAKEQP